MAHYTSIKNNGVIQWNKVSSTPCIKAWYLSQSYSWRPLTSLFSRWRVRAFHVNTVEISKPKQTCARQYFSMPDAWSTQTPDLKGGSAETNLWHLCGTCGLFVDPKRTDFPPQGFICPVCAWHQACYTERDGLMARQTRAVSQLINPQTASPSASPVTITSCCSLS